MSRWLSSAATAVVVGLSLSACTADPLAAPAARLEPDAPSRLVGLTGYQPTLLPFNYGMAINSAGTVLGQWNSSAAVYRAGVATALNPPTGTWYVEPRGMADDGRVLGQSYVGGRMVPVLYQDGSTQPGHFLGSVEAEAMAIGPSGIVAGTYLNNGRMRTFRWTASDGLIDIFPANGYVTFPAAVSADGYIAGTAQFYVKGTSGPLRDPGGFRWTPNSNRGVVLPWTSQYFQVLTGGSVIYGSTSKTWLWTSSGAAVIAPPGYEGSVTNISAAGRRVGVLKDPSTGLYQPWTAMNSANPTRLPLPSGYTRAAGPLFVNACGTIVGNVADASNYTRAVIWSRPLVGCDVGGAMP